MDNFVSCLSPIWCARDASGTIFAMRSYHFRLGIISALLGLLSLLQPSFSAAQTSGDSSARTESASRDSPELSSNVFPIQQGYVDAHGVMIYYEIIGHGPSLMIVHGGPGASHDYFLPYVLPLARQNRLIFIDERGSGRSEKLDDHSGYTVENMVEDVEDVRQELGLENSASWATPTAECWRRHTR